jgi:hypothetical protein
MKGTLLRRGYRRSWDMIAREAVSAQEKRTGEISLRGFRAPEAGRNPRPSCALLCLNEQVGAVMVHPRIFALTTPSGDTSISLV